MKSILKLFLFMSIILISKYTKENEVATASATMKTDRIETSFVNLQEAKELEEQEQKTRKAAKVVY